MRNTTCWIGPGTAPPPGCGLGAGAGRGLGFTLGGFAFGLDFGFGFAFACGRVFFFMERNFLFLVVTGSIFYHHLYTLRALVYRNSFWTLSQLPIRTPRVSLSEFLGLFLCKSNRQHCAHYT